MVGGLVRACPLPIVQAPEDHSIGHGSGRSDLINRLRSDMIDRMAPLFVLGLACALLGWAVMVVSSRIERERQRRHAEKFAGHGPRLTKLPVWIRSVRSWLLP
jgi:hypothetical protein